MTVLNALQNNFVHSQFTRHRERQPVRILLQESQNVFVWII